MHSKATMLVMVAMTMVVMGDMCVETIQQLERKQVCRMLLHTA